MPTNSVYENLFYGINEIPLFTYGMLGMTTVVLAYFTMHDIESASGEEEDSSENEKTEASDSVEKEEEEEKEQVDEKEDEEEEKEQVDEKEGEKEEQSKEPAQMEVEKPTNILETTTGNPMAELKNLTQDISKSISPVVPSVDKPTEVPAKELPVAETAAAPVAATATAATKPSVGGNKKRKTKRSNKTNKKTTRNHRKNKRR